MKTIKIIQFLHLIFYVTVSSQLIFYLVIMSGALKLVTVDNFAELRKAIDSVADFRLRIVYYGCLALSLATTIIFFYQGSQPLFITSCIALLCLVIDLVIAVKGNIPLNEQINTYFTGNNAIDLDALRIQWIKFITYRGLFIVTGMISLLAGLLVGRSR